MADDPESMSDTESTSDAESRSRTEAPAIDPAVLDLDHVFGVLDHLRRRHLLCALSTDDERTLRNLATKLAAWERDVDEASVSEALRDQMYVSLYHSHVPKLVEYGVIRFDEQTETIGVSDHTAQVFAVLEGAGASLDSTQSDHAGHEYPETEGS